jgi:uncharacterized protein YndB with AHSA1/START domain
MGSKGVENMPNDLDLASSVTIDAPAKQVWEALTTPEVIKRWFFGVETISDWNEGSQIVHKGEWQRKPYEDKGTILKIEPQRLLVHTHWSPMSGVPDKPENYQKVSWEVSGDNGLTELTVTEVNLPSKESKAVSEQSWNTVLNKLKELLER